MPFTEIDVDQVPGSRAEMQQRSGRTTVPQIFIGEQHVGGYDDLQRAGRSAAASTRCSPRRPERDKQTKTDTKATRPWPKQQHPSTQPNLALQGVYLKDCLL